MLVCCLKQKLGINIYSQWCVQLLVSQRLYHLRLLSTKAILWSLIKFFSTFGLPKIVQTDQGSNFMSRVFKQVLTQLNIKHHVASAYHPESQGTLERFHQTLKSVTYLLHWLCERLRRRLTIIVVCYTWNPTRIFGFQSSRLDFWTHCPRSAKSFWNKSGCLKNPLRLMCWIMWAHFVSVCIKFVIWLVSHYHLPRRKWKPILIKSLSLFSERWKSLSSATNLGICSASTFLRLLSSLSSVRPTMWYAHLTGEGRPVCVILIC